MRTLEQTTQEVLDLAAKHFAHLTRSVRRRAASF